MRLTVQFDFKNTRLYAGRGEMGPGSYCQLDFCGLGFRKDLPDDINRSCKSNGRAIDGLDRFDGQMTRGCTGVRSDAHKQGSWVSLETSNGGRLDGQQHAGRRDVVVIDVNHQG